MSEKEKYTRKKCLICEEFTVLKSDICMECDGGEEFVNKVYKFLRNIEIKTLVNKEVENLIQTISTHEKKSWVVLSPPEFGKFFDNYGGIFLTGWCYRVFVLKDKNHKEEKI